MPILIEQRDAVTLLHITESLTCENADGLASRFVDWLDHGNPVRGVLDLSQLDLLDSSGIGALVTCLTRARKRQGDLVVAGLHGRPLIAFQITRVDRLFRIFNDVDAAVRSFD